MPIFLLPLLKWFGSFLTGPLLQGALEAHQARLASQNSTDTRTVDLATRELAVEQRESELKAQVLTAEQGRWYTACIRPLFAAPFLIYNFKIIVWDKVFASLTHGVTDPLSPDLLKQETMVLSAYFIGRSFEKVTSIITTRRAK